MGCSASSFASKEECDAGGAFCTFDDPFCTTNIGLIIGIVAGVFVFIVLVSIGARFYFTKTGQCGDETDMIMGGTQMHSTNNNMSSSPNSNNTGGGWNSGNTMNHNNNNMMNNTNNTGGWNAGPSSPGGYGQQPSYPPPPPPPPGQPAPDTLPAPSFVGFGAQPPNQAY